ncbi:MAG: DNA translocase FtsK [Lachnospiraceae bacterium]|nr:DNA translocase FtsK [Lachnospiraceae bacterium]
MANSSGRRASSTAGKRGGKKPSGSGRKGNAPTYDYEKENELFHEIGLIIFFILMVILFLCNFGIIGPAGDLVSGVLFGLFGLTSYAVPVLLFVAVSFWYANSGNPNALRKLIAGAVLFLMVGVICELFSRNSLSLERYDMAQIYENARTGRIGGGVVGGSLAYLLHHYLETIGTVLVVLLCGAISFILMTEKSLISGMKNSGFRMLERTREDTRRRREYARARREEQEEEYLSRREQRQEADRLRREEQEQARARREEERRQRALEKESGRAQRREEKETEKILRMDRKVSGVILDTAITRENEERRRDDIHEIMWNEDGEEYIPSGEEGVLPESPEEEKPLGSVFDFDNIRIRSAHQLTIDEAEEEEPEQFYSTLGAEPFVPVNPFREELPGAGDSLQSETAREMGSPFQSENSLEIDNPLKSEELHEVGSFAQAGEAFDGQDIQIHREDVEEPSGRRVRPAARLEEPHSREGGMQEAQSMGAAQEAAIPRKYMFPPISLLQKGKGGNKDTTQELKQTAMRLQQTLENFGVRVTITDISQGPSVTRYELQPEQGVKVSKIVGLTDDIKLNLAATDIRIEAPIPGKAAIGIEVPNKENMAVALRDLLESKEFRDFSSNLAFAVGKDIGGQTVVSDIAKMPHMLIAGATGSGKSVCINTLIMSILYKAHPEEVKLIMVDPKVVELSVYNGIPHLLIPVVTDPKKASAALHWGVAEMTDRYKKFADFNVRDLKGYNNKVEAMRESDPQAPAKMPQIVIIVDELADLMMVSPGEVEESICRLAQLARAAGIHLIIATQRPSVDVITGLIKANMPSRVAFSVSSGVDSRTILDMNGAEKLLGKGDMLFYPQGYSKPARIQGAFVSDKEVSDVVDFLKNQTLGNTYAADVEEQLKSMGGPGGLGGGDERDEYFDEAGRFIIDKDKASIGMLQRAFKIGFNRAARIMEQLHDYGVVGEEEGTKPRKILMGTEEFEQLLEEIV